MLAYCEAYVSEHRDHQKRRQTGVGKWLSPPEKARFFSLLFEHALKAGVPLSSPEMSHFSRWAFYHARQCGVVGDVESARACLKIALAAADGAAKDIRLYKRLASVLGWTAVGHLGHWLEIVKGKPTSGKTLGQSWIEPTDADT